jgi:hypothetical protein
MPVVGVPVAALDVPTRHDGEEVNAMLLHPDRLVLASEMGIASTRIAWWPSSSVARPLCQAGGMVKLRCTKRPFRLTVLTRPCVTISVPRLKTCRMTPCTVQPS